MNELSTLLKTQREKVNVTQAELAKKLGFSTGQFVSNWERGISNPPTHTFKKISKILKLPIDKIIQANVADFRSEVASVLGIRR
jgi:transcriptional regulator with XRE-family HTH domain